MKTIEVTTQACAVCGKTSTLSLPEDAARRYLAGAKVQDVFPEMPADERELLISGTHPKCWDDLFGEEGDDD